MTYNILEYCRLNSINQFIFASSHEVYGNSGKDYRREDEVDISCCESPYTAFKLSGEALVQVYHRCYGMDCIICRFSNVYGMYDDSDRVIPLFIKYAGEGRNLTVYGEDKILDFTYIDDTVDGIKRCIQRFQRAKSNVFNITTGKGVRIVDVAKMIIEQIGNSSRLLIKKNRTGEVIRFKADISKAMQLLEYFPKTSIVDGISKTVTWYNQHDSTTPEIETARISRSKYALKCH